MNNDNYLAFTSEGTGVALDVSQHYVEPLVVISNTNSTPNEEILKIENDGTMVWTVNGVTRECSDFRDIAKAFVHTMLKQPNADLTKIQELDVDLFAELSELLHQ